MNLEQFIASGLRTHWIEEPGLRYYVRKSIFFPGVIELANCEAKRNSKALGLWRFIKKYENSIPFVVEQAINEDVAKFFRAKKWYEWQVGGIPQFASPLMVQLHGQSQRFRLVCCWRDC